MVNEKDIRPALLLRNGIVADGAKGVACRADVLVADGMIVSVAPGIECGECIEVDCSGMVVMAGFVDAHVHIESSMVLPRTFGRAVLPFGTTAVIADPHEIVNVAGAEGLGLFLDEASRAPIDIFTVIPSSVPATPLDTNGAGKFLAEDMRPFVGRGDVVGLGEVMCFGDVVRGDREIMDKIALFRGMTVDGHTAGMPAGMLEAYAGAGIDNDHECSDRESMMERYRCGMNIYLREGSAARNAGELLRCIREESLDTSRFAFCTDDKHLATIAAEGHISHIASVARGLGFDWGEIARMESWNPCRFYRLAGRGNVAPGYRADLAVVDAGDCSVRLVVKDGRIVARDGSLVAEADGASCGTSTGGYPSTVKFRTLTAEDFELPASLRGVALGLVDGQLLTRRVELPAGRWRELPRLATVERYGKNGNVAVCLVEGYGIRNGAIASSVSHDSHNVVCAGDNAADMAVACNRLRETGGGYAIASGGRIVGELPLPAFGLMSDGDAGQVTAGIAGLEAIAHAMGVNPGIDPFTTLSFVALPVIPRLRLLDTGLYDTETGEFIR